MWLSGQGSVPPTPLELPEELIILGEGQLHILLWEDVPGMDILLVSLPGNLRHKPR